MNFITKYSFNSTYEKKYKLPNIITGIFLWKELKINELMFQKIRPVVKYCLPL